MTVNCGSVATSVYDRLGGMSGIESFVSKLYDVMATLPEAEYVWKWHPEDIDEVKARLSAFLSGWLGGPVLYPQRYGPPMMRRRHISFPIGPQERDIWLKCARTALAETVPDLELRAMLDGALTAMADHMRNRDAQGKALGGCSCSQ